MESDATHAYRGYRLQALYTLERILNQGNDRELIFQPEGLEDLLVIDQSGQILEVIQVKAYSSDLVLSDFKPNKEKSFFYRINGYLQSDENIKIIILSFGLIGPELKRCFSGEEQELLTVAKRLAGYGHIDKITAQELLSKVNAVERKEEEVKSKVFQRIRGSMVGVDPERAFELLSWWMYDCAEHKKQITQQQIIERINQVGEFLSERKAFKDEWFTNIIPISDAEISASECFQLSKEYYQGMGARYEHILADLDYCRTEKLEQLYRKFEQSRVVVVHGASGQGKSTLAYRFLHDYYLDEWRFRVVMVDSRKHALNIARAMAGHAKALAIPVIVYIDVSPNDSGWTELVKQLYLVRNLKVLVTLREEEWRRDQLPHYSVEFEEMELVLEEDEAEQIYLSLDREKVNPQYLNFQEAWTKFGSKGPLLEFVFLLTQGTSLTQRLNDQVKQIKDKVRVGQLQKSEMELLRLVSVASSYGARLNIRDTAEYLQLEEPGRTLELFENEYLIRRTDDGNYLDGLHPVRSELLVGLLTDPVLALWADYACNMLPLMNEDDLEVFLLTTFSRRSPDKIKIVASLQSFYPKHWSGIAGVTNSLLWLGVKEYVDENSELIMELHREVGQGWLPCLDADIADAMPGYADTSFKSLFGSIPEENQERIRHFRKRQTDKKRAFAYVTNWLGRQEQQVSSPGSFGDWRGMAEALFWAQYLNIDNSLSQQICQYDLDEIIDDLPLELLGDLVFVLSTLLPDWYEKNLPKITERFRLEKEILSLVENEEKITSHYLISMLQNDKVQEKHDTFHSLTMDRINLMRHLFPNKASFACAGYGHRVWLDELPYDSSEKTGIDKAMLPPEALTRINGIFRELSNRAFRPNNWSEYALQMIEQRKMILEYAQNIIVGLEHYFRGELELFLDKISAAGILQASQGVINQPVMFPLSAIDEWGFISEVSGSSLTEKRTESGETEKRAQPLLFKSYQVVKSAYSNYISGIRNYLMQFAEALALTIAIKKNTQNKSDEERLIWRWKTQGVDPRIRGLSFYYLNEAVQDLRLLQGEFKEKFARFLDGLDEFQKQEQLALMKLWGMWYFFIFQPRRTVNNPQKNCLVEIESYYRAVCNELRLKLRRQSNSHMSFRVINERGNWETKPALYIYINIADARESIEALETCLMTIKETLTSFKHVEFIRYSIPVYCSYFVLVPLVAGKALNSQAWVFPIHLFQIADNEIGSWNYLPKELPDDFVNELSLNMCQNDAFDASYRLLQISNHMVLVIKHLQDIIRLPEHDDIGKTILESYLPQIMNYFSELTVGFVNALKQVSDYIEHELQKPDRIVIYVQDVPDSIIHIIELLRSVEEITSRNNMSSEDLEELVSSFLSISDYSNQIYSSISTYVCYS